MRFALAALSLLLAGTSAQAAIVTTGTISGSVGESAVVSLPMFTNPGEYKSYIAFSQPGSFSLAYHVIRITNFFCDFHDGQGFVNCGGDEVPVGFDLFASPGARSAVLGYSIQPEFRGVISPDEFFIDIEQAVGAGFEFFFEKSSSISYRVVTTAVPEPASWATMIAGFALAGAGLRSRKAVLA